jgi:hypothetical protein
MLHSKHINIGAKESESFSFLSDRVILIPRHPPGLGALRTGMLGALDIYTFDDPPKNNPPEAARRIASLQLPRLPNNGMVGSTRLPCRCNPALSSSAQSETGRRSQPRIHQLASSNRVLCLKTLINRFELTQEEFLQSTGNLFIPLAHILDTVAHLYGQIELPGAAIDIPWEGWGQQTSWLYMGGFRSENEYFVHGQRVVIAGVDFDERAVVFDFDPIRLKHDITPNGNGEPGLKFFNPESETIAGTPIEANVLRDMFLGGTCKASVPFVVRGSLISHRTRPPHWVMIDDEHSEIFARICFGPISYICTLLVVHLLVNMLIGKRSYVN